MNPIRLAAAALAALTMAACAGPNLAGGSGGRVLEVIAAEDVWGSIAAQLGGDRAHVQSVVTDPNADPHEYESSANDARAFAMADLVITNGAGYDAWASKLLSAGGSSSRRVVDVATVLKKKDGDNPHFWYDPAAVTTVAGRITAAYEAIDPSGKAAYERRAAAFTAALGPYRQRIAEIEQRFAGAHVGATESIFAPMAAALGLDLVSPPAFMQAVSEGGDPPAASVVTFQQQVTSGQLRALVYNVQTATAVTTNIRRLAAQHDVPVVGISETIEPETLSFQDWQVAQLVTLENALGAASPAQ